MIRFLFVGSLLLVLLILGGCGEESPIAPAIEDIAAAAPGAQDTRLTLKLYYFDMERKPSTRPGGEVYAAHRRRITQLTVQTHQWFARQMRQHGYGGMSFKLPRREANGNLPITYLRAAHGKAHYSGQNRQRISQEVGIHANDGDAVWHTDIFVLCFMNGTNNEALGGFGSPPDAYVYLDRCEPSTVRHELGHVFGLQHDFRNGDYVMSYGRGSATPQTRLSSGAAMWLSRHPAFKPQPGWRPRLDSWSWVDIIYAVPMHERNKYSITMDGRSYWLGLPVPKGDIPAPVGVLLKESKDDGRPRWAGDPPPGREVIGFINPELYDFWVGETTRQENFQGFNNVTELTFRVRFEVELPAELHTVSVGNITAEGSYGFMPPSECFMENGTTLKWAWPR